MPALHAIILGIVQGLSEFLPISSSGHLAVIPWLFHWDELTRNPDLHRAFDVALHIGTFLGAFVYFLPDVRELVLRNRRLGLLLLLSAVPAGITGVALDAFVENQLSGEWLIGVMLIVFAVVLLWADRLPGERHVDGFGPREALLMGAAQALALQPGVSRSGATISMGRWAGFDREAAARLSFLMSLPIIAGAGAYQALEVVSEGGVPSEYAGAFIWGFLASAVTGFAAVFTLLRFIRTRDFRPFVAYRFVAGAFVIAVAIARG